MHSRSLLSTLYLICIAAFFHARVSHATIVAPKFMIVSMYEDEGNIWYSIPDFHLLAHNITVPGLSPLFPDVHCTADGNVCQLTTGEAEINAANTIAALLYSQLFDLTKTYFMIAGVAGINPNEGTSADVTFARYAVQVALQYQFDSREIPENFTTGYFPQGSYSPDQYPQELYGTEVFEVNDALKQLAMTAAQKATLNDSAAAQAYRANYAVGTAAQSAPSVRACDVATSDVYFSGELLGDAFANYTKLVTNGTGVYCTTAQEDNATLEVLLRGATTKLVDFARIIIMRTASDFDRPYPGESGLQNLVYEDPGSYEASIENLYLAGIEVINMVLSGWDSTFEQGIKPTNYIGDILNTLGGTPDFGNGNPNPNGITKRSAPTARWRKAKRNSLTLAKTAT